MSQMVIEIRLLGRFEVHRAEAEVPRSAFHGQQTRTLVRVLASRRGSFVSRDVLVDAIWPVRPPNDSSGALNVLVHRARRALGDPGMIVTGARGYWLCESGRCTVDAETFLLAVAQGQERLSSGQPSAALALFRCALAVWRGEPLAEDAYDEWAQEFRRHLQRAHVEALEGAATAALTAPSVGTPLGDAPLPGGPTPPFTSGPERSMQIARMAVVAWPDHERASRLVDLALVEAGDDVFGRAYALGTAALLDTRHGQPALAKARWTEVRHLFEALGVPGLADHLRELAPPEGLDMLEHVAELVSLWRESDGVPASGRVDLSGLL